MFFVLEILYVYALAISRALQLVWLSGRQPSHKMFLQIRPTVQEESRDTRTVNILILLTRVYQEVPSFLQFPIPNVV